jgi:prepilin peptidase CpaA
VAQAVTYEQVLLTQWTVSIGLSLTAALFDLTTGRIPNLLTLPAWLIGLSFAWFTADPIGFCASLAASLLVASPCLLLFLFAGGGAGDVKLMAAIGSWLGLRNGFVALVAVSLATVVFGIFWALVHRRFGSVKRNLTSMAAGFSLLGLGMMTRKDADIVLPDQNSMLRMPYGVPIFLGVMCGGLEVWLWQKHF